MKKTLAALAVLGAFAGTAAAADVTLPSLSEYFSVSHYRISINGKIRHRAP